MSKIAVIGKYNSIYGFGAIGLDLFSADDLDAQALSALLMRLAKEQSHYGIIYITEDVAALIQDSINDLSKQVLPALVLIPGTNNNTGYGIEAVKHTVEQSVGSDILFGKD